MSESITHLIAMTTDSKPHFGSAGSPKLWFLVLVLKSFHH